MGISKDKWGHMKLRKVCESPLNTVYASLRRIVYLMFERFVIKMIFFKLVVKNLINLCSIKQKKSWKNLTANTMIS